MKIDRRTIIIDQLTRQRITPNSVSALTCWTGMLDNVSCSHTAPDGQNRKLIPNGQWTMDSPAITGLATHPRSVIHWLIRWPGREAVSIWSYLQRSTACSAVRSTFCVLWLVILATGTRVRREPLAFGEDACFNVCHPWRGGNFHNAVSERPPRINGPVAK